MAGGSDDVLFDRDGRSAADGRVPWKDIDPVVERWGRIRVDGGFADRRHGHLAVRLREDRFRHVRPWHAPCGRRSPVRPACLVERRALYGRGRRDGVLSADAQQHTPPRPLVHLVRSAGSVTAGGRRTLYTVERTSPIGRFTV